MSFLATKIKSTAKMVLPSPVVRGMLEVKHRLLSERLPFYSEYLPYIVGKRGIEIGGPSPLFKYSLPVYSNIQSLDGVNFSSVTQWEGKITEGRTYNYAGKKLGYQYISDGRELSQIKDNTYDFVLSSNCLEHIANPIQALMEWRRILKDNGVLILVLPNKISNFDHRRPTTTFEHLLEDYTHQITEYDLTHLEEILSYHDLSRDAPAGDIESFKKRSLDNFNNRCLHHHVFDLPLMTQIMDFCGFNSVLKHESEQDFFVLAIKNSQV